MESPSYIKALLKPNGRKPAGRRVWSIDLETVWLPFFTATNTVGDTRLPSEALGAPLRLGYNGDGSVKFSKTGRPVVKVVKEIGDSVKMVRENFVAGLIAYANGVAMENPDSYKAQVERAREAGLPIVAHDRQELEKAFAKIWEAKAEALKAEAKAEPKAEAEAKPKAKAKPKVKAEAEPDRELVAVA